MNKRISKEDEKRYIQSKKEEREERFVNRYYEEHKCNIICGMVVITIISFPFLLIKKCFTLCNPNKVYSENN